MNITLTPMRTDASLTLEKLGDSLIINGEEFDFSPLEEGQIIPKDAINSEWIADEVTRIEGHINVTIISPLKRGYTEESAYPAPLLDAKDGVILEVK